MSWQIALYFYFVNAFKVTLNIYMIELMRKKPI